MQRDHASMGAQAAEGPDAPLTDPAQTLRALLESTTDVIFVVDAALRIAAMNSRFARAFREAYGVELHVGAHAMEGLPPHVSAVWRGPYARALAGEASSLLFHEHVGGRLHHFDVHLSPMRIDDRIVGAVVISRDVTAKKEAEDAARASQAGLRAILDNTEDAIWSVDREYRLLAFNGSFERQVAQTYGSTLRVGEVVMDAFPDAIRAMWKAFYDRAFAGERFSFDFSLGEPPRYFEVSCSPIQAARTIIGACVQSREATARKRAEEALRATERQLYFADRMVTVGTLAAGVAHEINNPLAYLYSHVEILGHHIGRLASLAPEARAQLTDTLAVVQDGAERIRVIVHDLATFSRVDDESEPSIIDVHDVLDVALKMAGVEIRHRAQVVKEYGGAPPVLANPARLGQVLLNLLVNAAQAIPEGAVDRNRITLRTTTDADGRAVIDVIDTGCGIPADLQKRIFDPFFTTKPVGMGTGLGLSICHGIVQGMGGELSVASGAGEGATFRVALPVGTAPARRSAAKPATPEPSPPLTAARVLLVDDEPHLLAAWRQVLDGFETVACTTAREALETLEARSFDAIVCDIMMPDRTGMDLYEDVRSRWPGLEARILFVTGGVMTPRAREFLGASGAPLLSKPFAATALTEAVRALIVTEATSAG